MILFSKYMLAWGLERRCRHRIGLRTKKSHLSPNCVSDTEWGMCTDLSLLLTAAHEGMTACLTMTAEGGEAWRGHLVYHTCTGEK